MRGTAGLVFVDLGEQDVKNMDIRVHAYRVRLGSDATGRDRSDWSAPLPEKPSIAILPFDNLSGDPDQG